MSHSTRRNFLAKTSLAAVGTAAATDAAFGKTEAESTLQDLDQDVAKIVRSYGRARSAQPAGKSTTQIQVHVHDRDALIASFEQLAQVGDGVSVNGNDARVIHNGQVILIHNRVA